MAYCTNPNIEKSRGKAVYDLLVNKVPLTVVARKWGVHRSTVWRWKKKWQIINRHITQEHPGRPNIKPAFTPCYYTWTIKTESSRPHSYPNSILPSIEARILKLRSKYQRCAEIIWHQLEIEGTVVSLSTVKRVLKRHQMLSTRSKWKKYHRTIPRPKVSSPGALVEVDTIHYVNKLTKKRTYITTIIDLYTRMAYAKCANRLLPGEAFEAVLEAERYFGFKFKTIQSDNGPEFSKWFSSRLSGRGIVHRHTRIHRPNDNAHIERFNRTLRQECIGNHMKSQLNIDTINLMLINYIDYYNNKRLHLGIQCLAPIQMLQRW